MHTRRITLLMLPALAAGAMATSQADARSVQWGALVIDRVGNIEVGLSNDQPTSTRAVKAALLSCKKRGGKHCRKVTTFKNACGAMYLRPKDRRVGWGVAFYQNDAKRRAKKECGSSSCVYVAVSCTTRYR